MVDTGAAVSTIPMQIHETIGAWPTEIVRNLSDVHGHTKEHAVVLAYIKIPGVIESVARQKPAKNTTSYTHYGIPVAPTITWEPIVWPFALFDQGDFLIGLDFLNAFGITIDTRAGLHSRKIEIWEAFKTVSGFLGAAWLGAKAVEMLFPKEEKPKKRGPPGSSKRRK